MEVARESPSLIDVRTLPAVKSNLVVRSVPQNELTETFTRTADVGGFFQHLRSLASWADGISVYDEAALHVRLGVVVIAVIANNCVRDVYFPNIHFNHAPFQAMGFPLALKGKRPVSFESQGGASGARDSLKYFTNPRWFISSPVGRIKQ